MPTYKGRNWETYGEQAVAVLDQVANAYWYGICATSELFEANFADALNIGAGLAAMNLGASAAAERLAEARLRQPLLSDP
jgi:hypothetical protein